MEPNDVFKMYDRITTKELDFIFASRYEKPLGGSDDDDIITSIGNYFFTKIGNIFFFIKNFRYIIYFYNG